MIDSMILWMMITQFVYYTLSVLFVSVGLYEPGGILGGGGLKCV
jgi:hypothetical protein